MSLIVSASSGSGNFVQVPAGMHPARCYRIIDLGTQKTEYKGQAKMSPKVLLQFEVHSEDDDGNALLTPDGKPLSISKQYTQSLNENAILCRDLQSWRGRPFGKNEKFNLEEMLGQWCMLNVVHVMFNEKNYANIDNITPVPVYLKKNGMPEGVNNPKKFSLDEVDMEMFETFSDNIKAKIQASPEWESWKGAPAAKKVEPKDSFDDLEDDVPF